MSSDQTKTKSNQQHLLRNNRIKREKEYSLSWKPHSKKLEKKSHEELILLREQTKAFKKYRVFLDKEVGIDRMFGDELAHSSMDEDNDSSEEVVERGIKRALRALKSELFLSSDEESEKQNEWEIKQAQSNTENIETNS